MGDLPERLCLPALGRQRLVAVARGTAPAETVLTGGRVLDVYTNRVRSADIGIAWGRVAWVGKARGPAPERTIDLEGATAVPGLIEPHCHPDIVYTPSELARTVVGHGTTAVCADPVALQLALDDDDLATVLGQLSTASLKFFWTPRVGLYGTTRAEEDALPLERLERLIATLPGVTSSGELTAWPDLLRGDARLAAFLERVTSSGRRVDGHAAGASTATLAALAAAGITSDHEAITARQLVDRLEQGMWVMVRESSLRPDGDELLRGLLAAAVPFDRAMLTTDGPVASDVVAGYVDHVVRCAIGAGIPPETAVRMATLHPATYLGLDAHLGGVAPGRCADVLVVDDLATFRPVLTFCDGKDVAAEGVDVGFTAWGSLPVSRLRAAELDEGRLRALLAEAPVVRFEGVITRGVEHAKATDVVCLAALVSRDGDWIVAAGVEGGLAEAMVSTYTGTGNVLLLGSDLGALVRLYREVVALGGGILTSTACLPLPHLGRMTDKPMPDVAATLAAIEKSLSLPDDAPPLPYLSLFMDLAVLPQVRLTPQGVLDVKAGTVLAPPTALAAIQVA